MTECYQIKSSQELTDYLKTQGRDAILDTDFQLPTNCGWVHELDNGKVAFFTNNFQHDAVLFDNKQCFDNIIKKDIFPVENLEGELFNIESDTIDTFNLQADKHRIHLNKVLNFQFPEINKEAAQAYLKKAIGRSIKQLTTSTDILALVSVIGELVKQETSGKWFLVKSYGTYNPIYELNIVTSDGNVILMGSKIIGKIKWRTSALDTIFNDVHSKLTEPIKWKKYSKATDNLILLE